jgi:hypothetical protein
MSDLPSYLQPVAIIGGLALLLKYMVVEKLKQITNGLSSHERRIRRLENRSQRLHGALQAKGCMAAEACPLHEDEDEDEDED